LSQVVQAGFEPEGIAVAETGKRLLLRISTVGMTLAESKKLKGTAKRKTPKGGQKERFQREGHDG
jgi:hypothetical protein